MAIDPTRPYVETLIDVKTGEVKVEAHNYQGAGCTAATEDVIKTMGLTPTGQQHKPEYYVQPGTKRVNKIGGG